MMKVVAMGAHAKSAQGSRAKTAPLPSQQGIQVSTRTATTTPPHRHTHYSPMAMVDMMNLGVA